MLVVDAEQGEFYEREGYICAAGAVPEDVLALMRCILQSWSERAQLPAISVPMRKGDALCFTPATPHRALSNQSDTVRWSMDLRYEATATATESGKKYGFVARSKDDSALVSCEEWLAKWDGVAENTY